MVDLKGIDTHTKIMPNLFHDPKITFPRIFCCNGILLTKKVQNIFARKLLLPKKRNFKLCEISQNVLMRQHNDA